MRYMFVLLLAIYMSNAVATERISPGSYVVGGLVSIVAPFGIGHAIQGRYKEKGWIFTVSDLSASIFWVIGFGLELYGRHSATRDFYKDFESKHLKDSPPCGCHALKGEGSKFLEPYKGWTTSGQVFRWVGAGALLASRVWQIVDAWVAPGVELTSVEDPKKSETKLAFLPIITPNYLGFSLGF